MNGTIPIIGSLVSWGQSQIAAYATHTATQAAVGYLQTLPIGIVLVIIGVILIVIGQLGRWAQAIGGILIIASVLVFIGVV